MRFYTECLLSKWGFCDGDMLDDILDDNDLDVDAHRVLNEIILSKVIPEIDNDIEIYFIDTHHNPVRAELIDGLSVVDWMLNDACELSPEFVDVDDELILDIARNVAVDGGVND